MQLLKLRFICVILLILQLGGCIVVPEKNVYHTNRCEISSDRLTLRVVDLTKKTNSYRYYIIDGAWLVPLTGVVSGTFVAVSNIYNLFEKIIVCGEP